MTHIEPPYINSGDYIKFDHDKDIEVFGKWGSKETIKVTNKDQIKVICPQIVEHGEIVLYCHSKKHSVFFFVKQSECSKLHSFPYGQYVEINNPESSFHGQVGCTHFTGGITYTYNESGAFLDHCIKIKDDIVFMSKDHLIDLGCSIFDKNDKTGHNRTADEIKDLKKSKNDKDYSLEI